MESVVFYCLSGVSVAMAVLVAASRRPIYAVLALVGCSCALAGLYALLGATLLAAVQILFYAGAVGILFLIVTVLLDARSETSSQMRYRGLHWGAALLGLILFGLITRAVLEETRAPSVSSIDATRGSVVAMGYLILTDYPLPFLASAVLILAALVGATWLARR